MHIGKFLPGNRVLVLLVVAGLLTLASNHSARPSETVWLSSLSIGKARQGWGEPQADKSVQGNPISIGERGFERGVGTHAASVMYVDLKGGSERFRAWAGVDDEVGKDSRASVEFHVVGDGKVLWKSGVMKAGEAAREVDVPVKDVRTLVLLVGSAGDGTDNDHADWADARFEFIGPKPEVRDVPPDQVAILTPNASAKPRINGPKVFGVRPGHPFLFTIPATGDRPMEFAAKGLPRGLALDSATGQMTGTLDHEGQYVVTLQAKNKLGIAEREFRIVVGQKIALTPPLGWNSWNCWAGAVDQDKVLRAAKAMVSSGLINHGWTYINIDDTWQAPRGGEFNAIQGNSKFPDIKGLCAEIHKMGLKAGIYSTPWITSYAGYPGGSSNDQDGTWRSEVEGRLHEHGKFSFAENDAKQWAAWGIDYLKYDWNPNDVPHVTDMAKALRNSGRDIAYSLSNAAPYENAAEWARLANCWRTTGDIGDSWASMNGIGFGQDPWAAFAGPGHWNDPDMLVVGFVGWGPDLHPTGLTPNEQCTHISLWSLLSAPMLLGCDLERLDAFSLSLLTNDEVLEVSQDPLGQQARRVQHADGLEVWVKEMEGGSRAIGLFNRGDIEAVVSARWSDLGIQGKQLVRDLWRQQDVGVFEGEFERVVPRHGVVLVKITPVK